MDYKGAGILIYKIEDNKIYFLLGKENLVISDKVSKGTKYKDFGGDKCISDSNYIETASKQFYQETMGSFYSLCEMKDMLLNCSVFYNEKYKYHQFLVESDISEQKINTYNKIRSYLTSCMQVMYQNNNICYQKLDCPSDGYVEKSEIRWFELNDILSNNTIFKSQFINTLMKIFTNNILQIQ